MPGHYTNTSSIVANSTIVAATLRGLIDDLDDAVYDVDTQNVLAMPTGAITPFAGLNAPVGWLLCYGQAVSRTTYAALFALITTDYGVGDGSSTFNLPDLRGRTIIALDNLGGGSASGRVTGATTLGANGGAETHTLTAAQMPSHVHSFNVRNAQADAGPSAANSLASAGNASMYRNNEAPDLTIRSGHIGSAGSDNPHNNLQPYIALSYIIKT